MTNTDQNRLSISFVSYLLSCALLAFVAGGCENPEGPVKPNTAPDTRLANVPANDTIAKYILQGAIPEETLYWVGDDPDGYVIAFRYSWTDVYGGTSSPNDTVTLLNLTTIGETPLDTLVIVSEFTARNPGSLFRIYNFLATLDPNDAGTLDRIIDSLSTLRPFTLPYPSGAILTDSIRGADPLNNEAPTKGIFIFDSPADSNLHKFQVWAVDNSGAIDPTPATLHFWTLPSPGLIVEIEAGPTLSTNAYVLRYPTERNPGLLFQFDGEDVSTDQRDFSWVVDDTVNWSAWDPQDYAVVSALNFQETGSDTHTFYLRGRNRWGVISPTVSRMFTASVPAIDDPNWPKKTLVMINCRILPGAPTPNWMPPVDTTAVKDFYIEVLDSLGKTLGTNYDTWVNASHTSYAFPTRDVLSQYTSILLLSEQELPFLGSGSQGKIVQAKQDLLEEYLNIGGKLIFSSPPAIRFSLTPYDVFADAFLHVLTDSSATPFPFLQNGAYDFVGAVGKLGYPSVSLDTAKTATFPAEADGAIKNIALNYPRGFGQTIFEFDSKSGDPVFDNAPLGVRYLAPPALPPARETYSVVYFGFPLYYLKMSDVIAVLGKAFEDINE